jgi:hypothetical protein
MSDLPVMHVPLGTTVSLAVHAPRVMTVRLVMIVHLAQIAPIAHLAMNLRSAMDDLFAKAATLIRRASSTVRLERHAMTAVTIVPFVTTVPLVPIALFVTIVPRATTAVPHATIAHRALTVTIGRSALLVTIVVMTAVPRATTAVPVPIAHRAMTVRLVAIRTSIRRVTTSPSTNPATMSYSSVCRRWQPRRMTSMA